MITDQLLQNFSNVINYYTNADANSLPILKEWETNKKWLYNNVFDNQLKISFPIKIEIGDHRKSTAKSKLIRKFKHYEDLFSQIDPDSLVNNALQSPLVLNGKKYDKGMKVSKVFKKEVSDIWDCVKIEQYYSQMIGMFKISGNLVFSIDPIDFLTLSVNGYSWESCQELEDGEFKGGPLSFMTDSCTVVCYIEGSTPLNLNGVPVSNKKWRMLAHVNQKIPYVIFNSQYPNNNPLVTPIVLNHFLDLMSSSFPEYDYIFTTYHWPAMKLLIDDKDDDAIHFNDLLIIDENGHPRSKFMYGIVPENYSTVERLPKTLVGNYPICPNCGDEIIISKGTLLCRKCNPGEYCCTCGQHHHYEELSNIDSELFCETCFDNEFTYCEDCDELVKRMYIDDHDCALMTYVVTRGEEDGVVNH